MDKSNYGIYGKMERGSTVDQSKIKANNCDRNGTIKESSKKRKLRHCGFPLKETFY